jgi:hypothetical protein
MIRKCGQIRVLKTLYSKYEAVEGIPQMVIEANKIKVEQRNAWLENGLKNNWLTGAPTNVLGETFRYAPSILTLPSMPVAATFWKSKL